MSTRHKKLLTAARVRNLFNYDPNTGCLTWKVAHTNVPAGSQAGWFDKINGYRVAQVDGRNYGIHRLAWIFVYGEVPTKFVDHINGIRDDNRIVNLRLVDGCENQWNAGISRNNKYGFKGVFYRDPWGARIKVRGKYITLGFYKTKEEAGEAYLVAAKHYYGEFSPRTQRAPTFG